MSSSEMFDFQNYEFMEISSDFPFNSNLLDFARSDPNLNVTSTPEHLDACPVSPATGISFFRNPPPSMWRQTSTLTELTLVDQTAVEMMTCDTDIFTQDTDEPNASDLCANTDFDFIVPVTNSYYSKSPATVTLVKPQRQEIFISDDPLELQLLTELYTDDPATKSSESFDLKGLSQQTAPLFRLSKPPTDSTVNVPNLPLFEPLALQSDVQTPAFDELVSPTDTADTMSSIGSEGDVTSTAGSALPADRQVEIDRKASYIREVIEKRNNKPEDMSSKLKVHEVILVILLNASHGDKSKDLHRILAFCDENGREVDTGECRHFKTLDTETMGLLWQKIKGNKKGNYDTFARAMRVRRERSEGFFEYLDAGKGKKKRIYRFGARSMDEMARFKRTLRQVSKPQSCSY